VSSSLPSAALRGSNNSPFLNLEFEKNKETDLTDQEESVDVMKTSYGMDFP
jgi:hypothetical protein